MTTVRRRASAGIVLVAVAAIALVFAAGIGRERSPGAGSAGANLWVSTTAGGSPERCATLCGFDPAKAYGSFDAAWDAAAPGDVIRVRRGDYDFQRVTGDKRKDTKFIGEDGVRIHAGAECRPEFGGVSAFCAEGAHIWLEHVTLDGRGSAQIGSAARIWPGARNVTFKDVDLVGQHPFLYVDALHFTWDGGSHGSDTEPAAPLTCSTGGGEPLWLTDGADGAVIEHIRFNPKTIAVGPGPNCGADNTPHLETIRIEGADDVTIRDSRFVKGSDAGSGHIFSSHQPNDLKLIGNVFEPVNGTYSIQAATLPCNFTFEHNRFEQPVDIACEGGKWVGNRGPGAAR